MKRKPTLVLVCIVCVLIILSTMVSIIHALFMEKTLRPLSQPKFEIMFIGSNVFVKNIGDANATNVLVRRYLEGGLIILGKDKTVSFSSIIVGETKEAKMGLIFGLGQTKITVSVLCDEGVNISTSHYAMILFFFIL
ncbi:hypothetical protein AYK25_09510 [Thermoplasmatales archaeon SM1-50]|nr:MAG: hypothetical protein AYK25_09510 [Thermoplasmatales archaeon SM1-50]